MAKRPRVNFAANTFLDSYKAETEAMDTQCQLVREFVTMQMDNEFKANNEIREMLEKTYRMVYEQIDNIWQPFPANDVEDEVTKRKIMKNGASADNDENQAEKLKDISQKKPGIFAAKKNAVDPK